MKSMLLALLSLGALALPSLPAQTPDSPAEEAWAPHRKIRVLYAGKADMHREKVFGAFLKEHFDVSATIPLGELSMKTAADYDVVIVDWMSQYGCDGYPKRDGRLHSPDVTLGPEFTKPMIAMTYVGTRVRKGYKLDWL